MQACPGGGELRPPEKARRPVPTIKQMRVRCCNYTHVQQTPTALRNYTMGNLQLYDGLEQGKHCKQGSKLCMLEGSYNDCSSC